MEQMRFEEPRWCPDQKIEGRQNPEVTRLKVAIERIIAAPVGDPGFTPYSRRTISSARDDFRS